MPDPVTISVAAALAIAAQEVVKTVVGEPVKDAYKALKERLLPVAASEVAALEGDPSSKGKQLAVAEIVDRQTEAERDALRVLAQTLIDELRKSGQATGFVASDLKNVEVDLKDLSAEGDATAARIERMEGGKISASGVTAKGRPGN